MRTPDEVDRKVRRNVFRQGRTVITGVAATADHLVREALSLCEEGEQVQVVVRITQI